MEFCSRASGQLFLAIYRWLKVCLELHIELHVIYIMNVMVKAPAGSQEIVNFVLILLVVYT